MENICDYGHEQISEDDPRPRDDHFLGFKRIKHIISFSRCPDANQRSNDNLTNHITPHSIQLKNTKHTPDQKRKRSTRRIRVVSHGSNGEPTPTKNELTTMSKSKTKNATTII